MIKKEKIFYKDYVITQIYPGEKDYIVYSIIGGQEIIFRNSDIEKCKEFIDIIVEEKEV
jgi:hypothetical protein